MGRRGAGRFGCVGVHNRLCPGAVCLGNLGSRGFWRICGGLPELGRAKDIKAHKAFLGSPGIPQSFCVPPVCTFGCLGALQTWRRACRRQPTKIHFFPRKPRFSDTFPGWHCVHNLSITSAARLAPGCAVSRGEVRRIPENDPAYRLKVSIWGLCGACRFRQVFNRFAKVIDRMARAVAG